METIWIVLLIFAVLVVVAFRPRRENMTNKDLLEALSKFGEHKKDKSKATDVEPIYGPKTEKVEEPKPTPGASKGGIDDKMVYPDIYGPEITPIPGKKVCKKTPGQTASDCVDGEPYQFNPDLQKAFPNDGGDPQPFLTDFTKFQH
jgi:hypothetical protein